jgi:hypothetical protein
MIRWRRFPPLASAAASVLAVVWLTCGAGPVSAQQAGRLFEVRDVKADVTSDTAAEARIQAMAEAERRAFQVVLDRLTLAQDRVSQSTFSDAQVASATRDFWVSEEKVSPVRYIATLNYAFRPDIVRQLLDGKGVRYTTTPAPAVLVVPVLDDAYGVRLWQPPNPWLQAWREVTVHGLVPVVVPAGDTDDAALLERDEALSGDERALNRLADRYDTRDVVVAVAQLSRPEGVAPVAETARSPALSDAAPAPPLSDAAPAPAVDAAPAPLSDAAAPLGLTVLLRPLMSWGTDSVSELALSATEDETVDGLLQRAAEEAAAALASAWKDETLRRAASASVMPMEIDVAGLEDWLAARARLRALRSVRKVDIVTLSPRQVRVNVFHNGSAEDLLAKLTAAGFTVATEEPVWRLAAARPLPGR